MDIPIDDIYAFFGWNVYLQQCWSCRGVHAAWLSYLHIYIIYPLAIAKILGLIAIWSNYSRTLKEWAYAGFLYDFTLALSAHINAGDGELAGPIIALALLAASYFSYKSYFHNRSSCKNIKEVQPS